MFLLNNSRYKDYNLRIVIERAREFSEFVNFLSVVKDFKNLKIESFLMNIDLEEDEDDDKDEINKTYREF